MEIIMDKERKERIKKTLYLAITHPLETCVEIAFYIVSLAVGIRILGFALSFLVKIMQPMIFLT